MKRQLATRDRVMAIILVCALGGCVVGVGNPRGRASGSRPTAEEVEPTGPCLQGGEYPAGRAVDHRTDHKLDDARCCTRRTDEWGACTEERVGHVCGENHPCGRGSTCIEGRCCMGLNATIARGRGPGMAASGAPCCAMLTLDTSAPSGPDRCVQSVKKADGAACTDRLECGSLICRDGKCLSQFIARGQHCRLEEETKLGRTCGPDDECYGTNDATAVCKKAPPRPPSGPAEVCRKAGRSCSPGMSAADIRAHRDPYGVVPCCGNCGADGVCH